MPSRLATVLVVQHPTASVRVEGSPGRDVVGGPEGGDRGG
jgi:hypothetical protein